MVKNYRVMVSFHFRATCWALRFINWHSRGSQSTAVERRRKETWRAAEPNLFVSQNRHNSKVYTRWTFMCHNKTTENTLKSHIFIKVNEEAFRINPKLVLLTFQRNFCLQVFHQHYWIFRRFLTSKNSLICLENRGDLNSVPYLEKFVKKSSSP